MKRRTKTIIYLAAAGLIAAAAIALALRSYFAVPESLAAMAQRYPETRELVDQYRFLAGRHQKIDVSGELAAGEIPLFIQWDARWGLEDYGGGYMAVNACGPTCLSMVVCGLTGDAAWNPYATALYSDSHGYYLPGTGTAWGLMTEGAQALGLRVSEGEISAAYILAHASPATPLICSMTPGDFTTGGHFIVLTGVDEEGLVIVNDPNSRRNSEKHWDAAVLATQMKAIWIYSL
ncbi:MAG: C39 family peptidase [Clostridia bacterium]|nr:C39 family peptidase [Clostridia bacterium]